MKTKLIATLVLFFGVHAAQAETSADDAKARLVFNAGYLRMEAGDYVSALDEYHRAYALWPNVKILLNIGTALHLLGRNAEAADTYDHYLTHPDRDPMRVPDVERALAKLDAHLATLVITRTSPATKVLIDGKAADFSGVMKCEKRVEPGEHSLFAEEAGRLPLLKHVKVVEGTRVVIPIPSLTTVSPVATPAVGNPPPVPPVPMPIRTTTSYDGYPGRRLRLAGIGVAASGLTLVATGVVAAVLYANTVDSYNHPGPFTMFDKGLLPTYQTLEIASLGVGCATTIVGAVLVGVGVHREQAAPRALVAPMVGSGVTGVMAQLTF